MKSATILKSETGTHKPLVTGSITVAATKSLKSSLSGQGIRLNHQAYLATAKEQGISISRVRQVNPKLEVTGQTCHVTGRTRYLGAAGPSEDDKSDMLLL